MITNQKLHKALEEIRDITKIDVSIYSAKSKFITTVCNSVVNMESEVAQFIESFDENRIIEGCTFFRIEIEDELEYVLVLHSCSQEDLIIGKMAVCQVRNLVIGASEKYDRTQFIQNILLGNILSVDIMSKAKKLHIDNKRRVCFVIDTGNKENDIALEMVKNLSDIRSGDFVTSVDTHSVVLVKDVSAFSEEEMEESLNEIAESLVDNLQMEAMIRVRVGYGTVVEMLAQIVESFQEAKMSIEVGKIFYAHEYTISYSRLGIGRLIYQIPMSLCEMFIQEVFGDKVPDILEDEEAMSTINKFLENNLNISETARQLYVHRNTLVYRLERIEKAIGLDIRTFDDAMTFRIAVMVLAHMKNNRR
ncbi:MAG: helix-turn-helix domain-containing protein [Agathobacter sp.]|nr:helix-turn-helix domain-containing protein [Agathobacter sp.]